MPEFPCFTAQGDTGLLVYLGDAASAEINAQVRALRAALNDQPQPGVLEVLGAYASLLVQFDSTIAGHDDMEAWVREGLAHLDLAALPPSRVIEVPVMYGGEHGPDLEFVARHTGLSTEEVIRRHSAGQYLCYVVGFTPGFPYLGGLSASLACPRLDSPRLDLPPGSVGVTGGQTGLYPQGGPGGWQVIGRTGLLFYDPRRQEPSLVRAGDELRFVPVDGQDFPDMPAPLSQEGGQGRPVFKVIRPGGFTTIQDAGRYGYQDQGVPISGALDGFALSAANILLGNDPAAAGLEISLLGPKLRALQPVRVAVCGSDLGVRVDKRPAPTWQAFSLEEGQVLEFTRPIDGARAILALAGGVAAPKFLGSRSTYPLGLLGAPLMPGQVIKAGAEPSAPAHAVTPAKLRPGMSREITVRVVPGPHDNYFTPQALEAFHGQPYTLSESTNRRGMRLLGTALAFRPGGPTSILSEPNSPGVIQVPVGGEPIILLNEQTVGGYAKVATVISADLDLLARALPGDVLRFEAVDLSQAAEAARRRARRLQHLSQAVGG